MAWLNYHHLLYFSTVARRGSIALAAEELHLTQPAVSAQIKTLERSLKVTLLARRGRGLELTEIGRLVARHAEGIFALGRDLQETLAGRASDRLTPLRVGVVDALPKLLVHRLLAPVLRPDSPHRLIVHEGKLDRLLGDLVAHELDVIFADSPAPPSIPVRAHSHRISDSGITFLAHPRVARRLTGRFPKSLHQSPMLLPTTDVALRRALDAWLGALGIIPRIIAEIDDSAVLKTFGQEGAGVFAAPTLMVADIVKRYRVQPIGKTNLVRDLVYAITTERRLVHPGVRIILAAIRAEIGEGGAG